MQTWPDWNKLYANGQCLYYGVAFSDEQWTALDNAKNETERDSLVRKFREEYMKNRDVLTGELKKPAETEVKGKAETSESTADTSTIEDDTLNELEEIWEIKPAKAKKGK